MNSYTSRAITYGLAFLNTVLAAFKTVPGGALVATAKLRLSKDPSFNPQPNSTRAELATGEANFSGYTAGGAAVTLSAPLNLSPTCQGVSFAALFLAASATPFVDNNVYGYWIDDGTNVIVAEAFPSPLVAQFGAAGDFLELIVFLPEQALQGTT